MKTYKVIFISLTVLSSINAYAQDQGPANSAISSLSSLAPEVDWKTTTTKIADVTCDNVPDTIIIGYENNEAVWVGVVPGPTESNSVKPMIYKFQVGKHTQDSFCGTPVRIETGPIICGDEDIGDLPGCQPTKGCFDFSLVDDMCDSFHFYWDTRYKKLVWWRR